MPYVYGDSSPFPHEIDCIRLLRHVVDCCVKLLSAEHAICITQQRLQHVSQVRGAERAELGAVWEALKRALSSGPRASERTLHSISRVLEGARAAVDEELGLLEQELAKETAHGRAIVERAVEASCHAVQALLLGEDVPGTSLGLRLQASEDAYSGEVAVHTAYGLDAVLTLAIPEEHEWRKPRRVQDLSPGMEIHLPQEAGWLSKRVELAKVKLDRLFVSAVTLEASRAAIQLRKSAASGQGYQLSVVFDGEPRVSLTTLPEDGVLEGELPLWLDGEDRPQALEFWSRIQKSSADLIAHRQRLVSATFAGRSVAEVESPRAIAERLIAQLGPLVQEVARRSGTPSEFVLRRDLGQGRREELYINRSELEQKILILPPELRAVFEPCDLGHAEAAPSTPPSSEPLLQEGSSIVTAEPSLFVERKAFRQAVLGPQSRAT